MSQNHFAFELGGLPFIGVTIGMLVCFLSISPVTARVRRIRILKIDLPGGTPPEAPQAGLKVALLAWYIMLNCLIVYFLLTPRFTA